MTFSTLPAEKNDLFGSDSRISVTEGQQIWRCLMYIPPVFSVTDETRILQHISKHSFGTLITPSSNGLSISHLPFLVDINSRLLLTHLARANEHWHHFADTVESTAVFLGPHAYISPTMYVTENLVPTWNYVAIHIQGQVSVIESDDEMVKLLDNLVLKYEEKRQTPWINDLDENSQNKLRQMIVGCRLEISKIEAKFKLGQNRTKADFEKMINDLRATGDQSSAELASLLADFAGK